MNPKGAPKALTAIDRDLIGLLTERVRTLSMDQIARMWYGERRDPIRSARRRLVMLERAGMTATMPATAHPELDLTGPLCIWQPGFSKPNLQAVARTHRRRWTREDEPVVCVVATAAAGKEFGGKGGRFPRPSEITHDLHLAAVYLRMRRELPTRASSWVSEARLPTKKGARLPDAVVKDGRELTAIEFVGESYSYRKLAEFHSYCASRKLGYELW